MSQFRSTYFRPDVVAAVLDTLDEAAALQQANATAQRQRTAARASDAAAPACGADPRTPGRRHRLHTHRHCPLHGAHALDEPVTG